MATQFTPFVTEGIDIAVLQQTQLFVGTASLELTVSEWRCRLGWST